MYACMVCSVYVISASVVPSAKVITAALTIQLLLIYSSKLGSADVMRFPCSILLGIRLVTKQSLFPRSLCLFLIPVFL